jgi:signal transduction histidine kinase
MTRLQNNYRKIQSIELEDAEYSPENDINVGVITFAVTTVVLILIAMFFIKSYAAQKQEVISTLKSETIFLETFCREALDQNLYILSIIGNKIKQFSDDQKMIYDRLKHYSSIVNVEELFAWKEFIWIDHNHKLKVSSKYGILNHSGIEYKAYLNITQKEIGRAIYWTNLSDSSSAKPLIVTLMGLNDKEGKYIGSIGIRYNAREFHSDLRRHKEHDYTNFILFDKNYRVVMQSKQSIAGINIKNSKILDSDIEELVHAVGEADDGKPISYIDMMSGKNYYIKKIAGKDFILLLNIDKDEIRDTIFRSIVMKFLEISIFATMFFILIIAIYKREKWLRSRAEKAYQVAVMATNAKSDFLAFTAHEIRSPLGFIMTGSELMRKKMLGPISKKYLDYLEGIHKSAEIILDFINDILDEEHIIAGNFRIVETPQNILEIIDAAIKQNLARYINRKINITQDIDNDLPLLNCDALRILQVINNLLSNSIKYSPAPSDANVDISVKIRNGELVLKIRDQGKGMEESAMKIALTKYGRVYDEAVSLTEGYGLGLAIVKLLLDAHEASFCVESEVKIGTTITIIFPNYKLVYPNKKTETEKLNDAE